MLQFTAVAVGVGHNPVSNKFPEISGQSEVQGDEPLK